MGLEDLRVIGQHCQSGKLEEAWIYDNFMDLAVLVLDLSSLDILKALLIWVLQLNQILTHVELVYRADPP